MGLVRLAFVPGADFKQVQSDTAVGSVSFPIPRNYFKRRIYLLATGTTPFVLAGSINFFLSNRQVFTMPLHQVSSDRVMLPFQVNGTPSQDSILVSVSTTNYTVYPFDLTIAADSFLWQVDTVSGTNQRQFCAVYSENIW